MNSGTRRHLTIFESLQKIQRNSIKRTWPVRVLFIALIMLFATIASSQADTCKIRQESAVHAVNAARQSLRVCAELERIRLKGTLLVDRTAESTCIMFSPGFNACRFQSRIACDAQARLDSVRDECLQQAKRERERQTADDARKIADELNKKRSDAGSNRLSKELTGRALEQVGATSGDALKETKRTFDKFDRPVSTRYGNGYTELNVGNHGRRGTGGGQANPSQNQVPSSSGYTLLNTGEANSGTASENQNTQAIDAAQRAIQQALNAGLADVERQAAQEVFGQETPPKFNEDRLREEYGRMEAQDTANARRAAAAQSSRTRATTRSSRPRTTSQRPRQAATTQNQRSCPSPQQLCAASARCRNATQRQELQIRGACIRSYQYSFRTMGCQAAVRNHTPSFNRCLLRNIR